MSEENIGSLLKMLERAYPNAPQHQDEDTNLMYIQMWSDLPINVLAVAVKQHIATSTFYPTIAEIRTIVASLSTPELPGAALAWSEVRSYLPNILRGDCVTTPKLSNPIAQKVANAIGWRRLYFSQGYCEKMFISAYNDAVDREKQYALLPADVRQFKEQRVLKQLCDSVERELEAVNPEYSNDEF